MSAFWAFWQTQTDLNEVIFVGYYLKKENCRESSDKTHFYLKYVTALP